MANPVNYSVVIPVFNAASTLPELVRRIGETFAAISQSFEIILVDDFSSDNSWEVIRALKASSGISLKGIRLARNFGQHNATLCGITHASGQWVITIDDDLEFSPEDIPQLIRKQSETGHDLVYGVVTSRRKRALRRWLTYGIKRLAQLLNGKETATGSSFRLMRASLAKALLQHARYFSVIDEFVLWHTAQISRVEVSYAPSARSRSRYSLWRLCMLAFDIIFFSSVIPLRLVTLLGGLLIGVNFIIGSYVIFKKLVYSIPVEGYTSLLVSILFSTGIIIFSLGVIAEYISKLIKTEYNQPAFREHEII